MHMIFFCNATSRSSGITGTGVNRRIASVCTYGSPGITGTVPCAVLPCTEGLALYKFPLGLSLGKFISFIFSDLPHCNTELARFFPLIGYEGQFF
jgi:hypothetical protein